MAGREILSFYDDLEANPWWGANAALDNGTNYGALYCTFNVNGVPGHAEVSTLFFVCSNILSTQLFL